jgi:hypothetical protein
LFDWSFYALILVFPVVWYFLFGSWFKSQLGSLVSAVNGLSRWSVPWFQLDSLLSAAKGLLRGSVPISRKKKKCSHRERCARAKAKVKKWQRRALPVALVVRCWRISSSKAPRLGSTIVEPVRWKWKKKKVGLSSVMSELKSSTLQSFSAVDHDFLRLPQLLKTFCNHDYHLSRIKSVLDRVALLCVTFEMHHSASDCLDPKTLILIWDTGASAGMTPFCSNFIDYVECEIDVQDITKVNKVVGIGTTLHRFVDTNGNDVYLPCVSYHLPSADVCLFSPQIYYQLHGGHSVVNGDEVEMNFRKEGAAISIPIDRNSTNLPIVYNSFVSKNIKKNHASKFRSALHATGLYAALHYFANMSLDQNLSTSSRSKGLFSSFPSVAV